MKMKYFLLIRTGWQEFALC